MGIRFLRGTHHGRMLFRYEPVEPHRSCVTGSRVGGPIALVEEGDIIKINIPEMTLDIAVSDEEMAA